jgi:hypothetical protein
MVELQGSDGPCAVVELRGGSVPGGGIVGVKQLKEWNGGSRRKEIGVPLEDNLVYFTVHAVKKGNRYSLQLEIAS